MESAQALLAMRRLFLEEVKPFRPEPTQFDNQTDGFVMPENSMWMRFNVLEGETVQMDICATPFTETSGSVIVNCFAPLGKGTGELRTLADFVASVFRLRTKYEVTYRVPSILTVGRSDNGRWWQVNVTCPFTYRNTLTLR